MADRILKTVVSRDGKCRALIVQRVDGFYAYRLQWITEGPAGSSWRQAGPDLGLCDSAETAQHEARAKLASKLN
jgi:hypothetical protein